MRRLAATAYQEDPQRLLISVDCGIGSVTEAALARELGLELVITDHHQIGPTLPDAACLVHPRLPGTSYPFGDLCGVGVALKLAWGICQRLGDGKKASPQMRTFLMGAVGLAAIGTVADVVPLRGENRLLVKYGLKSLIEQATPGSQGPVERGPVGRSMRRSIRIRLPLPSLRGSTRPAAWGRRVWPSNC